MGLRRALAAACVTTIAACSSFGATTTSSPAPNDDAGAGADAGSDAEASVALDAGSDATTAPFCAGQPAATKLCDSFESGISSSWTEQVHQQALLESLDDDDAPSKPGVLAAASAPGASSNTPANAYLRKELGNGVAVHFEADLRIVRRVASGRVEVAAVYAEAPTRVTAAVEIREDGYLYLVPSNDQPVQGVAFEDGFHHVAIDVASGADPAVRVEVDGVTAAALPSVVGLGSGTTNAVVGITYAIQDGWEVHVDDVLIR
jgi:hypothetical protein